MRLCLFEDDRVGHLAPLVSTRPVATLRLGMRTLLGTARDAFAADLSGPGALALHTRPALAALAAEAHPAPAPADLDATLFVNARYVAEPGPVLDRLRAAARAGEPPRVFTSGADIVAAWRPALAPGALADVLDRAAFDGAPTEDVGPVRFVAHLWDLVHGVRDALVRDALARFGTRRALDHPGAHPSAVLVAPEQIFLPNGARIRAGAVVSAEGGPVVLEAGAEVMEGAVVRGPVYLGAGAHVKPLTSLEGAAIGPGCKVGGEVHTSIFQSNSNKGHAGFAGHTFLGAWCNLGAGTDTSNLRNDYGEVAVFDEVDRAFVPTGQQFVGLVMGDHGKCGIGTMFNTGTVVGVGCNLYGAGFHDRHVPDFSWGEPGAYVPYRLDKFLCVADAVLARRGLTLTPTERAVFAALAAARPSA